VIVGPQRRRQPGAWRNPDPDDLRESAQVRRRLAREPAEHLAHDPELKAFVGMLDVAGGIGERAQRARGQQRFEQRPIRLEIEVVETGLARHQAAASVLRGYGSAPRRLGRRTAVCLTFGYPAAKAIPHRILSGAEIRS
jgi:hypothetical protein